jgi:type I restriction enzyme S subunit
MTEELLEATFLDMFGDPVTNPKGWKVRPLKQLITGLRGGSPLKPFDFFDEGFPVFHKGAIKPFGRIQFDAKKRLCTSSDFAAKYSRAIIDSTFTVVTLRDLVPSGPSIGLMAQTKSCESPEYILAQGVYGFKPAADLIVPEYLVWMSNTTSYRRSLKRIWVGSTQIHIRTPVFFDMEVPVPPMPKQLEFQSLVNKLVVCELSLASSARAQDELFHSLTQRAFLGML